LGLACPLAITRSAALGRQIARATGAALENLEAFAVARAAAAAKVEFAAVLGVANRVGPTGHREWRAHHAAASRAACRLIAAYLAARSKLRADR
jgi:nucleoside phosphorylase